MQHKLAVSVLTTNLLLKATSRTTILLFINHILIGVTVMSPVFTSKIKQFAVVVDVAVASCMMLPSPPVAVPSLPVPVVASAQANAL